MRCERLQDLLPAYLDGTLPGRLNEHVSRHLDACDPCQRELGAQQRAQRALDAGRYPVSIDLWADFSRRLQAQTPPRPSPWRVLWQPGLTVAAAGIAVALIAGLAARPTPTAQVRRSSLGSIQIARVISDSAVVPMPARNRIAANTPRRVRRGIELATSASQTRSIAPLRRRVQRPKVTPTATHSAAPIHRGRRTPEPRRLVMLAVVPPAVEELVGHPASPLMETAVDRSGDPLRIAAALASAEEESANAQIGGELLRMAREVTRVSGEPGTREAAETSPGGAQSDDGAAAARTSPAGT